MWFFLLFYLLKKFFQSGKMTTYKRHIFNLQLDKKLVSNLKRMNVIFSTQNISNFFNFRFKFTVGQIKIIACLKKKGKTILWLVHVTLIIWLFTTFFFINASTWLIWELWNLNSHDHLNKSACSKWQRESMDIKMLHFCNEMFSMHLKGQ